MPDDVRLVLGSREFGGWVNVAITRTIESGAGSFSLELTDRWPGEPTRQPIIVGEQCELRIDDEVLITGWLDEVRVDLDGGTHRIAVSGRDAVGDLVDCAPDVDGSATPAAGAMPAQWTFINLLDLVTQLAAPFGIPVRSEVADLGQPFQTIALNPGQHAWELIEQACRYRQVLPVSDGRGALVLIQAGSKRLAAPIVEGQNLLGGSVSYSNQERFSEIIVKGQSSDHGFEGPTAGTPSGRALDSRIKRHRPLLIQADQEVDDARCDKRAVWEALTRAARAAQAQVRVQGWRTRPGGPLWPINTLIAVESPTMGLRGEFLVSEATYSLAEGAGMVTTLSVARPDAFQPPPTQEVPEERHGFGDLKAIEAQRQQHVGFGDLKKLEG